MEKPKMHADRKGITWEHLYKIIYTEDSWNFWGLFDFDNRVNGCVTIKAESEIDWKADNKKYRKFVVKHGPHTRYKGFTISGDADFGNLKKYSQEANVKMHSFPNFSIMPCTGGMNCTKGFKYRDKFHVFIYVLSGYYKKHTIEQQQEYIKSNLLRTTRNMSAEIKEDKLDTLHQYLNFFADIYDYCEKIHLLSEKEGRTFVDKLIKVGEANDPDMEAYYKLAEEYWEIRGQAILKKAPQLEEYINKNINDS